MRKMKVVIVGANDGKINDPLYTTLVTTLRERSTVLLVEP